MEACAVFAEIDEVGGPEERIERVGVLKRVCCWPDSSVEEGSDSGINVDCSREEVRRPSSEAGPRPRPRPGA